MSGDVRIYPSNTTTQTITVTSTTGNHTTPSITGKLSWIVVEAPGSSDTFTVIITNSAGIDIDKIKAVSRHEGVARAIYQSEVVVDFPLTITISSASADGAYKLQFGYTP